MRLYFLSIIVVIIGLSACSNGTGSYENVSTDQAKELIDQKEVVVIDVRTPEEYEASHIPNAELLPLQELQSRLNELDPEEKYLIVCQSGNRSTQASEILADNGFSNFYNMTGDMNNWTYDVQ